MARIRYCFALLVVMLGVYDTVSKPHITPRIYGGGLAEVNQFPFMVSFRAKDQFNKFTHICGATILSSKLILSAAHCTHYNGQDQNEYRVYIGASRRSNGNEYKIKRFIVHYANNPMFLKNDLMLIELVEPIPFSNYVKPATLHRDKLSDDVRVLAAGWRLTNDEVTLLKVVELKTITNFQCLIKLTKITSNPPVHKNVLCANSGKFGDGIGDGDSGGPLVTIDNKLVGVTSWAFGEGNPSGFTRISSFTNWIDEKMASVGTSIILNVK